MFHESCICIGARTRRARDLPILDLISSSVTDKYYRFTVVSKSQFSNSLKIWEGNTYVALGWFT